MARKKAKTVRTVAQAVEAMGVLSRKHKDVLVEVCERVAAERTVLSTADFLKYRTACVTQFPALFNTVERFNLYLEIGLGNVPTTAIRISFMGQGGSAGYINQLHQQVTSGGLTKAQFNAVIDKCNSQESHKPLLKATGHETKPVPKRTSTVANLVAAERDDGRIFAVGSDGTRLVVNDMSILGELMDMLMARGGVAK